MINNWKVAGFAPEWALHELSLVVVVVGNQKCRGGHVGWMHMYIYHPSLHPSGSPAAVVSLKRDEVPMVILGTGLLIENDS